MTLLDLLVLLLMAENNMEVEYVDEHMNVEWSGDLYCASLLEEGERDE